jgi:hypothetical protein
MKNPIIAATLLVVAGAANAASYSYNFGDVQQGVSTLSLGSSRSVATLLVADGDSHLDGYLNSVTFSLHNTFTSSLGTPKDAKIKGLSFSSQPLGGLLWYGEKEDFFFKPTQTDYFGPDYKVEFSTSKNHSFGDGETASWTIYGGSSLDASDFSKFLLHVNATGGYQDSSTNHLNTTAAGRDSINFAPLSAVPEPETWALLLTGLGLMGTIARRRRNNIRD